MVGRANRDAALASRIRACRGVRSGTADPVRRRPAPGLRWVGSSLMDVFEAINSRMACRQFLDRPVDLDSVRDLIRGAARAASSLNLQPWNVYAVTGEPLRN